GSARRRAPCLPEVRVGRGRGKPADGEPPSTSRPQSVSIERADRGTRRMSARDAILGRIRRSLGVTNGDPGRRAIVIARLENAPKGVIPARGQLPPAGQRTLFRKMAEKVSASVSEIISRDDIPKAVAEYLRGQNLPASVRIGEDPLLTRLPW